MFFGHLAHHLIQFETMRFYHLTQKAGKGSLVAEAKHYIGNSVRACTHTEHDRCKYMVVSPDTCGFTDTVASLYDTAQRNSQVVQGFECTEQMDWPYAGGTMRGGECDASVQNQLHYMLAVWSSLSLFRLICCHPQ